ncbi:MAG: hypothetical protein IJ482_02840 [Alphaproteobacteria bacterium]|nr:hypothetical protein [Alphaproteobacteria bacterium]
MSDTREMHEKFGRLQSGMVFIKDNRKRMRLAFRLARHVARKWDYIAWIAPTASLKVRHYVNLVNESAGNIAVKIFFFSQENISGNDWQYLKLYNLASKYKIFCIIDDSINIKNTDSVLTKRLQAMRHKFEYRLLLSKNPLTTSIKDIYGQMMFLDPLVFNMTDTQFLHNFMPQFVSEHNMVKRWSVAQSEQKAIEMMQPYILACDFGHNVRVKYHEYWFELTNKEKKSYQQEKNELLKGLVHGGYLSVTQQFQYYYTLCMEKVVALRQILSDIAKRGEKVIIYLKYSGEINFLEETGLLDSYQYVIMTGNSNKNRASLLFEVDYDVMICTYKVKIPRLNLHECANLIYFTQTFDYKDKLYILSKFSGNNRKKLKIYDFWVNTQLENLIRDNLARKQKLLRNVCEIMTCHKVATYENLSG